MKVLVEGGGGREHELIKMILRSPLVKQVYCAPGNAGIGGDAILVPIDCTKEGGILKLKDFAKAENINLTVIGRERPLAGGIVDLFRSEWLHIFGPTKIVAELEWSKAFAKEMMKKLGIATAPFKICTSIGEAEEYIRWHGAPIVPKADGLMEGKGVKVCHTVEEAIEFTRRIMKTEAGRRVVMEDCLIGEEASFTAIVSGRSYVLFKSSQDYKPVFDEDKGDNTGGMGAYAEAPVVTNIVEEKIKRHILEPIIYEMPGAGRPFRGVIYIGLMIIDGAPHVLEINVRFGDPEIQAILMLLKSDIVPLLLACAVGEGLSKYELEWRKDAAVCVVMASKGYPGDYETQKGKPIKGLLKAEKLMGSGDDFCVLHAGTALKDGGFVINGGRVLNVVGVDENIVKAIWKTYQGVRMISDSNIDIDGTPLFHWRTDIGQKALKWL